MVDDLGDAWAEIRQLRKDIERLKLANPLEAASVTSGRVRFIGGTLRVDSGGTVSIEGTLTVDGVTTVTGTFTVSGPWKLSGNGEITGKLVQNGEWELNGNGKIQGTVEVIGGGRIRVGTAMQLTPDVDGGAIAFQNDPNQKVYGNGSAVGLRFGDNGVSAGATQAGILGGSRSVSVSSAGIQMTLPTIDRTTIPGNPPIGTVYASSTGFLYRAV